MVLVLQPAQELLATLGQRLRIQRLAQGLPQRELAQMAGLSLGALRTLESTGQCSLETFIRTLQSLGLVGELENLFLLRRDAIASMERAEATLQRQRAPRRKRP
jgi:transcriptional regulator with XRE-family HTH domain